MPNAADQKGVRANQYSDSSQSEDLTIDVNFLA
jgi:hypothetical protein